MHVTVYCTVLVGRSASCLTVVTVCIPSWCTLTSPHPSSLSFFFSSVPYNFALFIVLEQRRQRYRSRPKIRHSMTPFSFSFFFNSILMLSFLSIDFHYSDSKLGPVLVYKRQKFFEWYSQFSESSVINEARRIKLLLVEILTNTMQG